MDKRQRSEAWEPFYRAVSSLVSAADIRARVGSAALAIITGIHDDAREVPAGLRERVRALFGRLASKGEYETTVRAMSDRELGEVAEEILSIYDAL